MPLFKRTPAAQGVNRLEQLLAAAATDVTARPEFYKEFPDSYVFVLGEAVGPSVNLGGGLFRSLGQDLKTLSYQIHGRWAAACFSSEARMREVFDDPVKFDQAKWIRIKARDLLSALLPDVGLVLNPKSRFGKEFTPEEVKRILDGSILAQEGKSPIPPGTQYYLRAPKALPDKLVDALTRYFRETSDVREAYMAEILVPSSGEPSHLILGITRKEGTARKMGEIVASLDRIVKGTMGPNEIVDVVEMGKGQLQAFMREQTKPFFTG